MCSYALFLKVEQGMEINHYGLRKGGYGSILGKFLHSHILSFFQTILNISNDNYFSCFVLFFLEKTVGIKGCYEWLLLQMLRSVSYEMPLRIFH